MTLNPTAAPMPHSSSASAIIVTMQPGGHEPKETHQAEPAPADDGYISFDGYESCKRKGLRYREDADSQPLSLLGPVKVIAHTEDGTGASWGILLEWRDDIGNVHSWAMPRKMLAGEITGIKERFLDRGLYVGSGKKQDDLLRLYLLRVKSKRRVRCVTAPGWHSTETGSAYVRPRKVYPATASDSIVYQPDYIPQHADEIRGTLIEWSEAIGKPAIGNSRLQFAICAALSGVLLKPAGEEGGIFHFAGASSTGKTTALHVGGSVTGGAIRSYRATDNSAESWFAEANDSCLLMDEMGQGDPRAVKEIAYMASNGAGKGRSDRGGNARQTRTFRINILSSGEVGLEEKLGEGGHKAKAGQVVRVVEIPADAGTSLGIFQNVPDGMTPDGFSRHLKEASAKFRGVVLDEFLASITADEIDLETRVRTVREKWAAQHVKPGSDGQVHRIAGRFALVAVAGEMAIQYGILPWVKGSASLAVKECFDAAIARRGGTGALEIEKGIAQVRQFIAAHGSSRFENPKDFAPVPDQYGDQQERERNLPRTFNRAGWREQEGEDWDYFILADVWRDEVCRGFDGKATARALRDRGLLKHDSGRLTTQKRFPGQKSVKVYHVLGSILADDGEPHA